MENKNLEIVDLNELENKVKLLKLVKIEFLNTKKERVLVSSKEEVKIEKSANFTIKKICLHYKLNFLRFDEYDKKVNFLVFSRQDYINLKRELSGGNK